MPILPAISNRKPKAGRSRSVIWIKACFLAIFLFAAPPAQSARAKLSPEAAINELKVRLENQRGPWLNVPGQTAPEFQEAVDFIEAKILAEFYKRKPELRKIPIRIHLFKNDSPNAWVGHFTRNATSFLFRQEAEILKQAIEALGHDPKSGFIELGITTGLLESLEENFDGSRFQDPALAPTSLNESASKFSVRKAVVTRLRTMLSVLAGPPPFTTEAFHLSIPA